MKAAIDILKKELENAKDQEGRHKEIGTDHIKYWQEQARQFLSAIAILKAAEKVDKEKALNFLFHIAFKKRDFKTFKEINALLESLPDQDPK